MATKSKKPVAKIETPEAQELEKRKAQGYLRPSVNAAVVIEAYTKSVYGEQDIGLLVDSLSESMTEINDGKLDRVENMLFGQANALQSIFVNLARKASSQEYLKQYETFLRLALKAQSQCRATLETLAAIKNPPVVFARQANIAGGHQQINNGTAAPAHAKEIESEPSKLSGDGNELLPDASASGFASRVNQKVEAVGAIDRAEVARG